MSPLTKKPRLHSVVIKSSSKEVSSANVKHLVGVDSKKIGGMQNVQDIPVKSPIDNPRTCNLP